MGRAVRWGVREAKYRFLLFTVIPLPWLLAAVLTVTAIVLGLKELYYDDSTFGDEIIEDYGVLFGVGLGATALNALLDKFVKDPQ